MPRLLLAGALLALPAVAAAQQPDTLPLQLTVASGILAPKVGKLCRVQVAPGYRYVGGQRFILQGVADAEQHFFIRADSSGTISRLYWIQSEQMLPGKGQGYTYAKDSVRTVNELPFKVDLRSTGDEAPAGSDGAAMREYLKAAGFSFPPVAPRLRLVYLPAPAARRELMVIYLEAKSVAGKETGFDATLKRGTRGLRFLPCP
jgi:hypothetical protein